MDKTESIHLITDAFHCDFKHQLLLGHLGNDMLNAADVHSSKRHFGMRYLNTLNKTWVLSRLAIELNEMPKEHDAIVISTWVENAMKFFTKRDWEITSEDGSKIYGYGKSIWAMIDTVTREPQDLFAVNEGTLSDYIHKEKECPIKDVSRVKTPEMTEYTEFKVHYTDLDVNGHLNSIRYLDHVMDTFPLDYLKEHELHRIEIAYVAEGHWGDTLKIYKASPQLPPAEGETSNSDETYYFRIVREETQTSSSMELGSMAPETELSRLKITFK